MPFVFLMLFFFAFWSYFLDQDPYLQQTSFVEQSSKTPNTATNLKPRTLDPNFYVTSIDGKLPGSISGILDFENPNDSVQCPKDRLYLQNDLSKVPEAFKFHRANFPEAEVPVECVLYAMRSYMYVTSKPSNSYSYCAADVGIPVRGRKTPCISMDYVYPVYNAYVDVMDCLAIPQTDLMPKLLNESGFHINVLGSGMDAGIGQLTEDAIRAVTEPEKIDGVFKPRLEYYIEEMRKIAPKLGRAKKPGDKESCGRVLSNLKIVKEVSSNSKDRCGLIAVPANPLRNLVYTAVFYRYMLEMQTGINYFAGKNYIQEGNQWIPWSEESKTTLGGLLSRYHIEDRLKQAGLKDYNINAIKQMMITLGYNAGPSTAVSFLSQYLNARINAMKVSKKFTLTADDMSFYGTEVDFKIFTRANKPADEAARKTKLALIMKEPFRGTFPVYLRLMQKAGAQGYLSMVASKYNVLNRALPGDNRCTSRNYLQF